MEVEQRIREASRSPPHQKGGNSPSRSQSRSPARSRSRSRSQSPRRRARSPEEARGRDRQDRRGPPAPSNNVLGVFGLSHYTRQRDLEDIFGKYGPLKDVTLVMDRRSNQSRGFGFIYYEKIEDAEVAMKETNGMRLDGRFIRVDFSTTQRAHSPTPGKYMGERRDRTRSRSRSRSRGRYDRRRRHYRSRSRSPRRHSRSRSRDRYRDSRRRNDSRDHSRDRYRDSREGNRRNDGGSRYGSRRDSNSHSRSRSRSK